MISVSENSAICPLGAGTSHSTKDADRLVTIPYPTLILKIVIHILNLSNFSIMGDFSFGTPRKTRSSLQWLVQRIEY